MRIKREDLEQLSNKDLQELIKQCPIFDKPKSKLFEIISRKYLLNIIIETFKFCDEIEKEIGNSKNKIYKTIEVDNYKDLEKELIKILPFEDVKQIIKIIKM